MKKVLIPIFAAAVLTGLAAQPEAKSEVKPAAQTAAQPEAKSEAKPAAQTAAQPAAKPAGKPSVKETQRNYHKHSRTFAQAKYYQIRNDIHQYLVYFQWSKATPKQNSTVTQGIPEPSFFYGVVARGGISATINGIKSATLEPQSITTFSEEKQAGIVVQYNFDGVKVAEKLYMTDDSPVLWVEWNIDPKSEEPVKKVEFQLYYWPCFNLSNGGRNSDTYKREIMTPKRTIKAYGTYKSYYLNNEENYTILYDAFYNPGREGDRKSASASAILFPRQQYKSVRIFAGNAYYGVMYLTPAVNTGSFTFGIYKIGKRLSMPDFIKYFQDNPKYFAEHPLVVPGNAKQ